MERVETSAKTVDEAVAKALRQLDLDLSEVEVEVVSEGRPGILGFGGEPARVIVTPNQLPAPAAPAEPAEPAAAPRRRGRAPRGTSERAVAEPAAEASAADGADAVPVAVEILERLLDLMRVEARVTSRPPATPGDGMGMVMAVLDVQGDDLGMLIGRRGETLASLQYVVNLMLARRVHAKVMVGIDVGGYRRRREESLRNLANRLADRVRATGQSITMEPMPPNERRIVHITLQDNPNVITVSIGEGEGRKVAITPRR
jgi:spoIIIJ-associated protein